MSKGKNFSCNNLGQRIKNDQYSTSYSLTETLLLREDFNEPIFEPACGDKAMVKVLNDYGYNSTEFYDLNTGQDFMDEKETYPSIITNPPFSNAMEFILKCKEVCTDKFALILPLQYLHGNKRYHQIWMDKTFPLKRVYVFTRYVLFGEPLRDDGKFHTGMISYAFYVWQKGWADAPSIEWININHLVLKKGE